MKRFVIGGKKCAVLRTMNERNIEFMKKQKNEEEIQRKNSNFGSVQLNDIHLKTATANIHCVHWSHFKATKCWKDTILLLRGEKTTKTKKILFLDDCWDCWFEFSVADFCETSAVIQNSTGNFDLRLLVTWLPTE